MSRKIFIAVLGAVASLLILWFVWPTEWVYGIELKGSKGHAGPVVVPTRTNRFTGIKQFEYDGDWNDGDIVF